MRLAFALLDRKSLVRRSPTLTIRAASYS